MTRLKCEVPIIAAILFIINISTVCCGELSGPGVCWENVTRDLIVPLTTLDTYQETSYLCASLPNASCNITTNHTVTKNSFQVLKESSLAAHCCSGYKLSEDGNSCVPICSQYCEVGSCTEPNACVKCVTGFIGLQCVPTCPAGTYGHNCTSNCTCTNGNYYCNPVHGCMCKTGYAGSECKTVVNRTPVSPALLVIVITIIFVFIFGIAYLIEKARDRGYSWHPNEEKEPLITERVTPP